MQKITVPLILVLFCAIAQAQELYVSTEPASNMAAGSIGLRLNTRAYIMDQHAGPSLRINPELMVGVSRKLMLHLNAYASSVYQPRVKWEGAGIYGKYRFLSHDDVHSHFRMAAFGKASLISNPAVLQSGNKIYPSDEIDADGNNSGMATGLIATQLLHKLALSATADYRLRWNNVDAAKWPGQSAQALNGSLSAGYLLFPAVYRDFRQTNVNLYVEFLGSSALDKHAYYLDAAPAIQWIFNSISRLDISYRTQLTGNMERLAKQEFLLRLEYNFLNVFKNR